MSETVEIDGTEYEEEIVKEALDVYQRLPVIKEQVRKEAMNDACDRISNTKISELIKGDVL